METLNENRLEPVDLKEGEFAIAEGATFVNENPQIHMDASGSVTVQLTFRLTNGLTHMVRGPRPANEIRLRSYAIFTSGSLQIAPGALIKPPTVEISFADEVAVFNSPAPIFVKSKEPKREGGL